ncbi:hypothetical protein [Marinobacter nauticus]|uniref:hypothetical protein n=1 Tax=Marinobacter nauticus TaxID=2743 RepID=UPI001CFF05FF|nr:hypothetical protein [Marinobacter nauticus]
MKQNIHIWLSLLIFGLLIVALVDDAHATDWIKLNTYYFYGDQCTGKDTKSDAEAIALQHSVCTDPNNECKTEVQKPASDVVCMGSYAGQLDLYYRPIPECENLSHEPGGTINPNCNMCSDGYIPATGPYSPDSGSSVSTGFQCMRNREPNECKFLGKYEVETAQGAFCVDQCAGIGDGGYCIDEAENDPDEPQCSPDHPEFKGVAGYGGEAVLICGDPQNNCKALGDGYTWGVVEKNGTTVESCFPNAYNPPQCSGTDVLKKDQWGGFACLPLRKPGEDNQPGGPNDPNNGDSDGDGQGDITGITGQLQDIKKLLGRGNTNTDNLNETLKGLGNQIKDGTKAITDAIGNIPGGGGGGNGSGSGDGDGDGDGEDPAINWSGDPIDLKIGDGLDELNAIQGEYENLIANIRSEMASSFGSFTGGGGLEDNNVTLYGETFNAGLSKFGAHLSIVGSIILFAAAFIGLGIVMGAKD